MEKASRPLLFLRCTSSIRTFQNACRVECAVDKAIGTRVPAMKHRFRSSGLSIQDCANYKDPSTHTSEYLRRASYSSEWLESNRSRTRKSDHPRRKPIHRAPV